jgi:indole-3-glycerol phosphate synthase
MWRPNRARTKVPEHRPKDKMPVSLQEILSSTQRGLPALRSRRDALERQIEGSRVARPSFHAALRRPTVAIIAEVKRRSPSAGSIREDLDPGERASLYAAHGAAAISVLTDGPYFGGSMQDLRTAAERCPLPLLRKDFILEEVQILEARAASASAVLLIVRVLERPRLDGLLRYAADLGLDALVEVHARGELETALEAGASIIGVNSRDLDTFRVDTEAAWKIVREVPPDRIAVAESGMAGQIDVMRVAEAGADAVLIGTALSAAPAPERLLAELAAVRRHGR